MLGQEIRRLRLAMGMTLQELSKLTGLREAYLAAIEDGREEPSAPALERIASHLEPAGGNFEVLAALLTQTEFNAAGEYAHTRETPTNTTALSQIDHREGGEPTPKETREHTPPAELRRSVALRVVLGLVWVVILDFMLTVLAVIGVIVVVVVAGGGDAVAARMSAEGFGRLFGWLLTLGALVLGIPLSIYGVLPGTSKYKTSHRCPRCWAESRFDRVTTKSFFGSWRCSGCDMPLRLNRLELIFGVALILVVAYLTLFAMRIGLVGLILPLLVWPLAFRVSAILSAITPAD